MSLVVTISGSPSPASRTPALAVHGGATIAARGFEVETLNVRDLPPEDLLHARAESPALQRAVGLVERARGVVISTPVYKASYTGVLKAFLDVLPQFGLGGKVVLPLVTGGTLSHVLAIDYALRPVLSSLGAQHVVGGLFILDKLLDCRPAGGLEINSEIRERLTHTIADFVVSLQRSDTLMT